MRAKILVYALAALILATIHLAEAQQAGESCPHRLPGSRDCFRERGSRGRVSARTERSLAGLTEKNITIDYRFAEQKTERTAGACGGFGSS